MFYTLTFKCVEVVVFMFLSICLSGSIYIKSVSLRLVSLGSGTGPGVYVVAHAHCFLCLFKVQSNLLMWSPLLRDPLH